MLKWGYYTLPHVARDSEWMYLFVVVHVKCVASCYCMARPQIADAEVSPIYGGRGKRKAELSL
jgi:hypothetical protein